jgi:hypothetical protein
MASNRRTKRQRLRRRHSNVRLGWRLLSLSSARSGSDYVRAKDQLHGVKLDGETHCFISRLGVRPSLIAAVRLVLNQTVILAPWPR